MGTVLIRQRDGEWRVPSTSAYEAEDALQRLLFEHPQLIPRVQSDSRACREFETDAGRTDVVVVEPDGSITLVECKLDNNPQVRREIVGQLFDYASRLGLMSVDEFDAQWVLRTGSSLFAAEGIPDIDYRDALARNLAESRFRLVLAVDAINPQLRRIVEYLNRVTRDDTSVIAVEYARYADGDVEILTPQTYGEDLAEVKTARRDRGSRTWSPDAMLDWAGDNERSSSDLLRCFVAGLTELGFVFKSGHSRKPTATYCYRTKDGRDLRPIQMWIMDTTTAAYIEVELNFSDWAESWMKSQQDETALRTLQKSWAAIPALERAMKPILAKEGDRRSIRLAEFDKESQRQAIDALRTFVSGL